MKKKFWILIIYLILILTDGLITYINTPDLALEGNPLVSVLGLGWSALFVANLVGFILLFFLTYYAFIKYETVIAKAANRREYCSQLFYHRPDKFIWSFYKVPKRWQPFWACLGYVLIYSAIFNRIIIVCEWLLPNQWFLLYSNVRSKAPYGRLDIVLTLVFCIYLLFRWFNLEYQQSKKVLN